MYNTGISIGFGAVCSGSYHVKVFIFIIYCNFFLFCSIVENCSCSNNGTCNAAGLCSCNPGWSGEMCEIKVASCPNCANGVCNATLGHCVCHDGFTGEAIMLNKV